MKLGAIDIGTNSMRLLLAEYKDFRIVPIQKYINTTRIGQDVDNEGMISEEAINRNLDALKVFYNLAKQSECEKIYCIGTSALRDAKNGEEFVKKAKQYIGIDVRIIDGEEEAELGFRGVIQGIEQKENILVIDIGGGSTEFIFGSYDKIEYMKSENVGALRMTERFISSDIIEDAEMKEVELVIRETIRNTIKELKGKNIQKVVGIGGTITSLSAINQELEIYSSDKIHNSTITKNEIGNILQKLKLMTLSDKKALKGLQSKRADIITAGVKILDIIVEELEIDKITVSEYDNLEGMLE